MEFSREGKHTIRCVITEEEILELGYTIDEIISNGKRTQDFMNQIFDLAEQEFQTKFDLGIKTVRADFLPDHTLSLTFSEHPGTEGMMEHIKDIVNGLISSIPQKRLEEIKKSTANESSKKEEKDLRIIALFAFEELDILIRYAKQVRVEKMPFNQLYKLDDVYFLIIDLTESTEEDVRRLSALTDEYSADVFVGAEKRAYLYEHGKLLLKDSAIEQLRLI